MIIHEIKAARILRYQALHLQNLPASGVIGISGSNESGKSSIGEIICFALFGRTFSQGPKELHKLVRWGESSCSVILEFSVGEPEQRYRLERYLDLDGNHSANLTQLADGNILARGVETVADQMFQLLGYEFEEFIESFYLAQREITAPHPQSDAVKSMAGVAPLEFCLDEYQRQIPLERGMMEQFSEKVAQLQSEIDALNFSPATMTRLQTELDTDRERLQELDDQTRQLARLRDNYATHATLWQQAERSQGGAGFWRLLALMVGLALLAIWALPTYWPEQGLSTQLMNLLRAQIPGWQDAWRPGIVYGAGAFLGLGLVLWMRGAALKLRIGELRQVGVPLEQFLDQLAGDLRRCAPDSMAATAPELMPDSPDWLLARQDILTCRATVQRVETIVQSLLDAADRCCQDVAGRMEQRQVQMAEERELEGQVRRLQGMQQGFIEQLQQHEHRIVLREMATELLNGASRELSNRFNHNLKGLVGKTLPLFTESRYEHLQIDPDLVVRVFSAEKRDFMDFEELSSGTQRQIMLALRLALSQELINRVVEGPQFAFLDEPFAFFDESRTRSSLAVLPDLSAQIRPIWVVAQAFPAGSRLDREIHCQRNQDQLIA